MVDLKRKFPSSPWLGRTGTATIYLTLAVGVRWINIAREDGLGGADWFEVRGGSNP